MHKSRENAADELHAGADTAKIFLQPQIISPIIRRKQADQSRVHKRQDESIVILQRYVWHVFACRKTAQVEAIPARGRRFMANRSRPTEAMGYVGVYQSSTWFNSPG